MADSGILHKILRRKNLSRQALHRHAYGGSDDMVAGQAKAESTEAGCSTGCPACPAHNLAHLTKLGVNVTNVDHVVALAGNPNTGKSTVFNNLTGMRQHTGNWPGKTVKRAEGAFSYQGKHYKLVDLPGSYSLLSMSADEEIARDFIIFGRPDVTVIVADATQLERNLNLVLQILEITDRVVICLNLMDEARRHRMLVDERPLARALGVPVVPTVARYNQGMDLLTHTISEVATGKTICRPHHVEMENPSLRRAISELVNKIEATFPGVPNSRWVALRLLAGDQRIIEAVRSGELADLAQPAPESAASPEAAS